MCIRDRFITGLNISISGLKVILVPFFLVFPVDFNLLATFPYSYLWFHLDPSLEISTSRNSDKKFTTVTPTPWRPPETA